MPAFGRLLLVEDNDLLVRMLDRLLQGHCSQITIAGSVAEVKSLRAAGAEWDLVVSDYHLPDGNGEELCFWLRDQEKWRGGFLIISGRFRPPAPQGEYDFLPKPFSLEDLLERLQKLNSANTPGGA